MQHLLLRQLFITNPSRSIGLKKPLTLFFKFPGQFHNFQDKVSESGTVPDNPGRMACMLKIKLSINVWKTYQF